MGVWETLGTSTFHCNSDPDPGYALEKMDPDPGPDLLIFCFFLSNEKCSTHFSFFMLIFMLNGTSTAHCAQ